MLQMVYELISHMSFKLIFWKNFYFWWNYELWIKEEWQMHKHYTGTSHQFISSMYVQPA